MPQSAIFIPNRDATCTTQLHPNITDINTSTWSLSSLSRSFVHFILFVVFSFGFFPFRRFFSLFRYIACSKDEKKAKPCRINAAQIDSGRIRVRLAAVPLLKWWLNTPLFRLSKFHLKNMCTATIEIYQKKIKMQTIPDSSFVLWNICISKRCHFHCRFFLLLWFLIPLSLLVVNW